MSAHAEAADARILEAAVALWSEKGYAAASMREVAHRGGIATAELYGRFPTKADLVRRLYQVVGRRVREAWDAEPRGHLALAEGFRRFLEIKLAVLEPYRPVLGPILREAIDPDSGLGPLTPGSSKALEEGLGILRELATRDAPRGGLGSEPIARLLWLAHVGVLAFWLHDPSGGRETRRLVERIGTALRLLPFASILPSVRGVLELVAGRLAPPPVEAREPAGDIEVLPEAMECDVAVIGAGPMGALYASFLRRERPGTRVVILDRAAEPGHKIGESTLSGFCKAMRTVGIEREALQALFFPKNGLGFHHVDESVRDLAKAPEYVLEAFDETFQVERRVLDSLLVAQAQRLGAEVVRGARVALERSRLSAAGNVLAYDVASQAYALRCPLVVDASGPAGALARRLGLHTSEGLPFQTSAVWTYVAGLRPLAAYRGWASAAQSPRDQYTQHLCFREGWLWYIPVVSWQAAPTANLGRLLDRVLRPGPIPARADLARRFACPTADVVSVGLVLRSDRDALIKDDPRGAFEHYRRKYPAIAQLLEGGRILSDYYGPGQTFMSRLHFRGHSRRVAGDGWLLVGDAAFFVDPLISPGLTGGTATAYQAALASARALDAGVTKAASFADYEEFVHRLHEALERDNQLVYMSFNHPEAMALVQRFQEIDARRHFLAHAGLQYGPADTNVWGILDPAYQEMQRSAWAVLREEEESVAREASVGEQSWRDYQRMVSRLRRLLGGYVTEHVDLTPFQAAGARPWAIGERLAPC